LIPVPEKPELVIEFCRNSSRNMPEFDHKGGQEEHFIKCLPNIVANQTRNELLSYWLIDQVWFVNMLGRNLIKCSSWPHFVKKLETI
jgi:hypothetical protein